MIRIREAVVVEGKYDKITLSQWVDTVILETSGFGLFKDRAHLELLRRIAAARGLIVLTDADGGGLVIRNYLRGAIDPAHLKHAYIPCLPGKERRKPSPGREGLLGVEGMDGAVLEAALRRAGATVLDDGATPSDATSAGATPADAGRKIPPGGGISKLDMYELGLSGGPGSAGKRRALQAKLGLPQNLSATALLDVLNALYTMEELEVALEEEA